MATEIVAFQPVVLLLPILAISSPPFCYHFYEGFDIAYNVNCWSSEWDGC
ncbi:hypothetical protein B4096_0355 [Heyndrickxia coagulans]|jgi:hypothetical protein|nr:hypothetical protein B4096_0355 [Heyndrickxia coagulans]